MNELSQLDVENVAGGNPLLVALGIGLAMYEAADILWQIGEGIHDGYVENR